jgi:hypothetical protein
MSAAETTETTDARASSMVVFMANNLQATSSFHDELWGELICENARATNKTGDLHT